MQSEVLPAPESATQKKCKSDFYTNICGSDGENVLDFPGWFW